MKSKLLLLAFIVSSFYVSVAQNYKFGKVSKEELLQKQHPQDSAANAAVLYRETKTEFQYTQDSGWYMVTDYFERIKIYKNEGFDWANVTIDTHKGEGEDKLTNLKAYTYYLGPDNKIEEIKLKSDGIFEEESSKYLNQTKITMPDLREGCVIEYKYTITSPFIFNIDKFKFQEQIPVDKVLVMFNSPEYFVYKTHQQGWVPYKVDSKSRERAMSYRLTATDMGDIGYGIPQSDIREVKFKENMYTVELVDVPAIKEEAYSGSIDNYATTLQFELSYMDFPGSPLKTYSTTWEDVSKGIYGLDIFGNELERKNYFEDDITNLLSGVSDSGEKMNRVFSYVKNKMNWNKYNGYYTNEGVKDAYKKGSGNVADINLMLVAMLRFAGLEANPVLVSTKTHGIPLFPTRNGFNYVIAAVEKDNKVILLDATNKYAEPGVLQPKILNWQGMIIKKNGASAFVKLSPYSPAVQSTMVNVNFLEDLSVTGDAKNRFTGNYALKYRSEFKDITADDQRKMLEKDFRQAELSNVKFENLSTTELPVSLDYNFESFDAVEEVGGKLYFSPMLFMASKESPFKVEERNFPIDYGYPVKDRYIVNINIPEGYTVESLPENSVFTLGENIGSFKYIISQIGNKLQLSVELSINEALIAATEYGNLKKFYELLISKENEKVVLSRT